jgi:hypothetical protein
VEQALPLRVKVAGRGFVPVDEPLSPKLTDAPGARVPFQVRFVAVTWVPVWVTVADQACVTRWPLAYGKVRVQPLIAAGPVFVSVMVAVKPPPQSLVAYPTRHGPAAAVGDGLADGVTEGLGDGVTEGLGDGVTEGLGDGVTEGLGETDGS